MKMAATHTGDAYCRTAIPPQKALLAAHSEPFDLLLGRHTYDIWSGFWPKAPGSPLADSLNAATKYVVTNRPDSLEWGPFKCLEPDILLGKGKRFFSDETPPSRLALASTNAMSSGVLINSYTPVGPAATPQNPPA